MELTRNQDGRSQRAPKVLYFHHRLMNRKLLFALVGLSMFSVCRAADSSRSEIIRDIEYARLGERELKLDLYVPGG
jgi:hypothetical protein